MALLPDERPLYQQIYAQLRAAILAGELKPGSRLPSTRSLAKARNISRNTALSAYQQLLAEGYIESIPGSGMYVSRVLPEALLHTVRPDWSGGVQPEPASPPWLADHARQQQRISQQTPSPPTPRRIPPLPFSPEAPALDVFPYPLWSRIIVRQTRRLPGSAYLYQDGRGYRPLREAIAAHVAVARQILCSPDQILITPGSQGALHLAVQALLNPNDPVWLEDPGYPGARGAFAGAGAQVIPVPVDEEGLVVAAGIERAPQARLVYLTPSHQFPLGVTMSLPRRLALLDWARRAGAYLLEDDYDSEYRFIERPLAPLYGLADAERVIYMGTFSKVLFPALRLGYLILPPTLVDGFLAVRRYMDIHPPMLEQAALAEFMAEGHLARHLRRMRTVYAERRAALLESIRSLPLELLSAQAGIHCAAWLPADLDFSLLSRAAVERQVDLTPLSRFSLEPLRRPGLLLGYGGFPVPDLGAAAHRLEAAFQAVYPAR